MLIFILHGFWASLRLQTQALVLERVLASSHPSAQFLLLSPHRWQTTSAPPLASLGLIHANLGAEGGGWRRRRFAQSPSVCSLPALSTAEGITRFGVVFATKARLPGFAPLLARLGLSREEGEGCRDGVGGREKGTNLHLALQSGMRRMHKQLLCSRRCRHLSPTAPQTRTPEPTSEGSSASP